MRGWLFSNGAVFVIFPWKFYALMKQGLLIVFYYVLIHLYYVLSYQKHPFIVCRQSAHRLCLHEKECFSSKFIILLQIWAFLTPLFALPIPNFFLWSFWHLEKVRKRYRHQLRTIEIRRLLNCSSKKTNFLIRYLEILHYVCLWVLDDRCSIEKQTFS